MRLVNARTRLFLLHSAVFVCAFWTLGRQASCKPLQQHSNDRPPNTADRRIEYSPGYVVDTDDDDSIPDDRDAARLRAQTRALEQLQRLAAEAFFQVGAAKRDQQGQYRYPTYSEDDVVSDEYKQLVDSYRKLHRAQTDDDRDGTPSESSPQIPHRGRHENRRNRDRTRHRQPNANRNRYQNRNDYLSEYKNGNQYQGRRRAEERRLAEFSRHSRGDATDAPASQYDLRVTARVQNGPPDDSRISLKQADRPVSDRATTPRPSAETEKLYDTKGCTRRNTPQTKIPCPSSAYKHGITYRICINDHDLCNGRADCPQGEDEDPVQCMFHKSVLRNFRDVVNHVLGFTDHIKEKIKRANVDEL